jgi:benzylsuccinate CoA-transferase BbsF subunit
MNKTIPSLQGNRHLYMAPHGCYRCRGDDKWVAIAVKTEAEWKTLCMVIGSPSWTTDERFADQKSRWDHQDILDEFIEQWTRQKDHYTVMSLLQNAGVACGPVLSGKEILDDPHLKERRYFIDITHPETGTYSYAGNPVKMSGTPAEYRKPPPCFGEHNDDILTNVLGYSLEEIRGFKRNRVVCDHPEEVP